jgi:hypothetical protein
MPVLIDSGDGISAADIWRTNWGWMLEKGATTWWEVFDDRWSHCHYWSGAPTWQLSRYGLGLHPQLDSGGSSVILRVSDFGLALNDKLKMSSILDDYLGFSMIPAPLAPIFLPRIADYGKLNFFYDKS